MERNLSESELSLALDYVTLNSVEAGITKEEMIFKRKEQLVKEKHKNKITERRKGYYYTRIKTVNGSKLINARYDALIEQLYTLYYGICPEALTLNDIRRDYEIWYAKGRKPSTLMDDRKTYNKDIRGSRLSEIRIKDIKHQDMLRFFDDFSAEHCGEYCKSKYDKLRTVINNMLEYALVKGYIETRPASVHYTKSISVRFKQSEPRQTHTQKEHEALIRYLNGQDDQYSFMYAYMLLTGDRFETASALRTSDVYFDDLYVYLHFHQIESGKRGKERYMISEGTKGNSSHGKRYMPITTATADVLRKAISAHTAGEFVFEINGKPINPATFRTHVKKICQAAGVPYHYPHSTRNYAATIMRTGDNDVEMMEYFGWSSPSMPNRYKRNIYGSDRIREQLHKLGTDTGPQQV